MTEQIGLRIKCNSQHTLKVKTDSSQTVMMENGSNDEVREFTYVASAGITTQDTEVRLVKARVRTTVQIKDHKSNKSTDNPLQCEGSTSLHI